MAKFGKLLVKPVEFETSGGEKITLCIKPLSRFEKLDVIQAMTRGESAQAERLMMRYSVDDWVGVQDDAGRPIKFNMGALDDVFGADNALAVRVSDHLFIANGLGGKEADEAGEQKGASASLPAGAQQGVSAPPLDRSSNSESVSGSTAES